MVLPGATDILPDTHLPAGMLSTPPAQIRKYLPPQKKLPATRAGQPLFPIVLIKIGKPPALLGNSQSLIFRAMKKTSILEPFKVSGKEVISGSSKPKPFNMGMQLSCGMDTQIQDEENIQGNTDIFGNCSANLCRIKGKQDFGRSFTCRSCTYAHIYTSKIFCIFRIGYIKGKSALYIARQYNGKKRNFGGESFWARGYYVSTVGLDEETIRNYIKYQEEEDKRLDQLSLV